MAGGEKNRASGAASGEGAQRDDEAGATERDLE